MLILTRRVGENVMIGDDIVISVIEVRGDAVRIGINAPRAVAVHREEVYRELQQANAAAAASSDEAIGGVVAELLGKQCAGAAGSAGAGAGGTGAAGTAGPSVP